jgi:hypothetical protein
LGTFDREVGDYRLLSDAQVYRLQDFYKAGCTDGFF